MFTHALDHLHHLRFEDAIKAFEDAGVTLTSLEAGHIAGVLNMGVTVELIAYATAIKAAQ